MPNDAKLGLVVGVGLVITAAVVFARKEPATASPTGENLPTVVTPATPVQAGPRRQFRPAKAKPATRADESGNDDPSYAEPAETTTKDNQEATPAGNATP